MLGAAAGPSPVPEQPGLTKQSTGSHLRPSLQEHDIQEIFPRTNSLTSPGEWKGEREQLDELLRRDRAESTDGGNVSNSRSRQGRQNA